MPKLASAPLVKPETWRRLLSAAADFAALSPWEFMYDGNMVGLIDPTTGETRIGCVLGNAEEVFAAVFYRRGGLRWILSMLSDEMNPEDMNNVEEMEFLQLEFVPRKELLKQDKAVLKAAGFKPVGNGAVWPKFRAAEPGLHPWHITQAEAETLLADIPRLTAFCRMLEMHPNLFEERSATEAAFLPTKLPDRPLTPEDIDWHPFVRPPTPILEPFRPTADQLDELHRLKQDPGLECEFDSIILPGASFVQDGRPCFGRISMMVETQRGAVSGVETLSGALPAGEAAGRSLVTLILKSGSIPSKIFIGGSHFEPALRPLCDELKIQLHPMSSLPACEKAIDSLGEFLLSGAGRL